MTARKISSGFAPISLLVLLLALTALTVASYWAHRGGNLGTGAAAGGNLNLVQNPSFESWSGGLPASWSLSAGTVSQDGQAASGSYDAYLTGGLSQAVVGVVAGATYSLSFKAKGDGGTVSVAFKNRVGSNQSVSVGIPAAAGYIETSQVVNFPVDLQNGSVVVSFSSLGAGLYLDEVSLEKR